MVERGWLGEKTGVGFYRKDGAQILALDWKTLEHRERRKAKFASVEAAQSVEDVGARLRQILGGKDKAAQFLDRVLSSTCLYAASLVPEIVGRRGRGGPGHGVGLRLGPGAVPAARRARRGGRRRAGEGGGPRRPAARRGAAGRRPRALLRDDGRRDDGLRPVGRRFPCPTGRASSTSPPSRPAGASGRRTRGPASSTWATAARSSSSTRR